MATEPTAAAGEPGPRPPLGKWSRAYALVLGALALEIALLWLLTVATR